LTVKSDLRATDRLLNAGRRESGEAVIDRRAFGDFVYTDVEFRQYRRRRAERLLRTGVGFLLAYVVAWGTVALTRGDWATLLLQGVSIIGAAWVGLGWMANMREALSQMWLQRDEPKGFVRTKLSDLVALVSAFFVIIAVLAGGTGLFIKLMEGSDAGSKELMPYMAVMVIAAFLAALTR